MLKLLVMLGEVYLPLHPALMWHLRCLSTVSTFVMYLCCLHMFSIIFSNLRFSISTDMGNNPVRIDHSYLVVSHDFYDFVLHPGR